MTESTISEKGEKAMKKSKKTQVPNHHRLLVNGYEVRSDTPAEMLSEILSTPTLDYWSYGALKRFYCGAIEMVHRFCELRKEELKGPMRAKMTRFSTVAEGLLMRVPKSREGVLEKIYDTILSGNRLGRLPGFGMSNRFGDKILLNPERASIYRGYTGLREK